jgi:DNA-binding GntR family transcriptional regulator
VSQADSVSTVEKVAGSVARAVREGRLVPGQRLTEADFAGSLGVSRSSVREAFRRLTADGLLAFEPHRGVTVRKLSRREVDNLFAVRGALEALAVGLAFPALRAAPERLLALQAEMDRAVEANDVAGFSRANGLFHAAFTDAADNALLAETLARLSNSIYWLQFRMLVDQQQVFHSHRQHRAIVAAVIAGDLAVAETAMRDHVEASRQLVQQLPDSHFSGGGGDHLA